ncbi:hypothetical protein ACF0H5_004886 [Mactra antiquata]
MDVKFSLATVVALICIFLLAVPVSVHGGKTKKRLKALEQQFATINEALAEVVRFQQTLDVASIHKQIEENAEYIDSNKASLDKIFASLTSDLTNEVAETKKYIDSKVSTIHGAMTSDILNLQQKINSYQEDSVSETDLNRLLQKKKIAFTARVTPSVTLQSGQTLVFRNIQTNDGNAYSNTTGVFTAPTSGTYVFFVHILGGNRALEMKMMKNEESVMLMYANGPGHGADSNMVILQLTKDDKVKVAKHGPWGTQPFYVHHMWTTFSGFMLYSN